MTGTDSSPAAAQRASAPNGDGHAHLDRSLTHGVAWMGSVKWLSQLLAWASTFIVARLLTPADYGLVGLATMYLGIVTLLSEFGIGTTVVTLRDLSQDELAQINTLSLLFGAAGFVVSCLAAPLLAAFFDAPGLTWVVVAMAGIFLITGVRVVPQAILQRDMRFRDLAINDGLQSVILAVGAVVFASMGFRYWTLVLSSLLGALLSTIGVLRLVRVPFQWPRWRALSPALRFSQHTIVGRLAWYVYQNADFFVAGKLLTKDALGAYRFGWDVAHTPVEKLTSLVGGVTPAILSAAQHDRSALKRYILRISEALALLTFPATIGIALVAGDLVPLALGDRWVSMVAPLQLLGVAAGMRSVAPILPQVLVVTGENRQMMRINVVGAIVMPVAFVIGAKWGTTGIAIGWLTAYPLFVLLPLAVLTFRQVHMSFGEYLHALRAPLSGVVVMSAAVWSARFLQPDDFARPWALATDIAVGAVAYGATLLLLHRERMLAIVSRIRGAMS
ncbi:MAG: lipopolysaccharide biosynthesis protein [Gemmatimonadaceae bacterium]|nr:lipopolysaccharide biosynthesis protein [Gemmatimonadaceae bacterium]